MAWSHLSSSSAVKSPVAIASAFTLSIMLVNLAGCASRYELSTFDGDVYHSRSAPTFKNDSYTFQSENGETITLPYRHVKTVKRS